MLAKSDLVMAKSDFDMARSAKMHDLAITESDIATKTVAKSYLVVAKSVFFTLRLKCHGQVL